MTIEISRLKIVAKTIDGDYGVDIPFKSGLFLLRVENSHGKSTCMNAIAYALGMEKALGLGSSKVPFPPALTKVLTTKDNKDVLIQSSYVLLEIKNSNGDISTLKRNIIGAMDNNVIHISKSSIEASSLNNMSPYFLHKEGDTSRSSGFFYWLAQFLKWEIPFVPNHNGKESPLYPSIIFPTWFVEQKKGWTSIQATTPTQFGIKEPKKRALEFILSLDVNENINKRNQLKSKMDEVIFKWKEVRRRAEIASAKISAIVTGIPEQPDAKFDNYKIDVVTKVDDKAISILDIREELFEQLFELNLKTTTVNDEKQIELVAIQRISSNSDEIKLLDIKLQAISDEKSYIQYQISSANNRINNLFEDRRKYEDLKKVADSNLFSNTSLLVNECPTCGTSYTDNLVDLSGKDNLMTYEDSLIFIKEQIKAFEFVVLDSNKQLEFKLSEQTIIENKIAALKNEINRLKNHKNPSIAIQEEFLRTKINLENRIDSIDSVMSEISQIRLELDSLHQKYLNLFKERKKLPASVLSTLDNEKFKYLKSNLIQRLDKYTFSSFDPSLIDISQESYQPTREGYDIGFDTSASDGIRIIWGYLISLFLAGRKFGTNHPGILVFDEPRQQEANKISFAELLRDAELSVREGGQIIFATSEERHVLEEALGDMKYTIVAFDKEYGKLIQKFI